MSGCEATRDSLLDYLEGELGELRRRRVEVHLGSCPECAAELASLRATRALIASMPLPAPAAEFWRDFEGEVRRRIAELPPARLPLGERLRAWLGQVRVLQPAPALGAAVALGVLLAVGLAQTPRPGERPPTEIVAAEALGIGMDLDVLRDLDVLELLGDMEFLETLPPLARHGKGRAAQIG